MKRWLGLSLLTFTCAFSFNAQDITGSIGGTILDPAGATIPNAKVTVTNKDRNQVVRNLVTDSTGSYSIPYIPIGTYAIKVEAVGFKAEERTGIVLNVADDLRINIRLQVGATSETVEVQAEASTVELGTPASASTIEGRQVTELSLAARNYEQLMALIPGVAVT